MVDQPVGEAGGAVDLADERMRQQGLEHPLVAAVEGGLERQVLVRRDVRDESGVQRRERLDRQGPDAGAVDLARAPR